FKKAVVRVSKLLADFELQADRSQTPLHAVSILRNFRYASFVATPVMYGHWHSFQFHAADSAGTDYHLGSHGSRPRHLSLTLAGVHSSVQNHPAKVRRERWASDDLVLS